MHIRFRWGNLREGSHLDDLNVEGRIILKWVFNEWDGGMDWIDMGRDRDRWLALVTTALHLRVP